MEAQTPARPRRGDHLNFLDVFPKFGLEPNRRNAAASFMERGASALLCGEFFRKPSNRIVTGSV